MVSLHGCMIKKELFISLGKFDVAMGQLALADLCLKMQEQNKKCILDVYTTLEINVFDNDNVEHQKVQSKDFEDKWKSLIKEGDPMYNPNLKSFS